MVKIDFIVVNKSLDKAILFFISVSHLTFGVITEAQVFKGAYLYCSFPYAKNVTYRNV